MTKPVEETGTQVAEGIDGFFTKLTEATDIVTTKLIAVAPDAAVALLKLVQMKGIFDIASAFIVMILSLTMIVFWLKKVYPIINMKEETTEWNNKGGYWVFWGAVPMVIFIAFALNSFFDFLSFYSWISILYPEGAVAMKALEAAGIEL